MPAARIAACNSSNATRSASVRGSWPPGLNAAAASNTQTPIADHSGAVAWRGMLDPLRPERGDYVPAGRYRMRFERNGQEMLVDLDRWEALSGGRGFARVRSADDELPSVLLELGGH